MNYRLRNNYPLNPQLAMAAILQDRGVSDIDNFLRPSPECELDPFDLENIEAAAEMLMKHLRADSRILFIVDADTDGYTSSSVLWLYIKHIYPGARLDFTIHEHKQHGLSDKIDWIEEQNFNLVIVPDAGSYNVEEHRRLYELGIDCLVLDHHSPEMDSENNTPPNTIIVNNQLSPRYRNKSLCGVGVVYKFCEVLDKKLRIKQSQEYLDLVALGEIADVMDKRDTETNYLMMAGLRNIKNKGFQTLLESQSYSLKEHGIYPYEGLNSIDIAFYISPLINAIIRVGSNTEKENLFYCFITPDRQVKSTKRGAKEGDKETAAEQIARASKNAKSRQDKAKERALDMIDFRIQKDNLADNNIILVEVYPEDNIQQELTGLIAMGIVSKYHKPCMIVRRNEQNELQGSLRSDGNFAGLPSFKVFLEESNCTMYVAGHDNAAGVGIMANNVSSLMKYANTHLDSSAFENCYIVDYILDARENNTDLLTSLASYPEYFGNQIDDIHIVIENITLSQLMVMGSNKDSIKISYNGIDYVKFKDNNFIEEVQNNRMKKLTVYGTVNLNTYNNVTTVQVFIRDYELKDDAHKYDF